MKVWIVFSSNTQWPTLLYVLFASQAWSCAPACVASWDLAGSLGAQAARPGGPPRGSWHPQALNPQDWSPAAADATHWSSSPTAGHTTATGQPREKWAGLELIQETFHCHNKRPGPLLKCEKYVVVSKKWLIICHIKQYDKSNYNFAFSAALSNILGRNLTL